MTLSCFDLGERMLSVEEALAALDEMAPPPLASELVPLAQLCDRVLAENLPSPIDVPQNTNAAMDGIALSWGDDAATDYRLVGTSLAGHGFADKVPPQAAVAITTGAPLPRGADTVIMREQLREYEDAAGNRRVIIEHAKSVKTGQHVRQAGEDLERGELALSAGTRLGPQHLGLLASLGVAKVPVHRRPRVAIFSTGDEVTAPGEPLPAAGIFDANRFSLHGLLNRLGCEVIDLGILADDPQRMVTALSAAADSSETAVDMVLTSGGVSVGDSDWIKSALETIGELGFWRIAIRPGRPLAFGRLGSRRVPFFGLPGNPVAVMVTFLQFVQPMLRRLQGQPDWRPARLWALAEEPLKSREGRVDFLRGIYHCDKQGRLRVRSTGRQGSGILSSMTAANCLIEIRADQTGVEKDQVVALQPFNELF